MLRQAIAISSEGLVPIQASPELEFINSVADQIGETAASAHEYAQSHKGRIAGLLLTAALSAGAVQAESAVLDSHIDMYRQSASALAKEKGSTVRTVAVVGSVGAAAYVVANNLGWLPWNWDIHGPTLGSEPPKAVAAVKQDSYEEEMSFNLICTSQVSVAVGVTGIKSNHTWESDGELDKRYYADFLLCGDDGKLHGSIKTAYDDVTGEVIRVEGVMPQLEVTHPRIDMLDDRNCVSANSRISTAEANKKIAERREEVANGEHPGCDDGFNLSNAFLPAPENSARLISLGMSAAQLAVALDAEPKDIIIKKQAEYEEAVYKALEEKFDVPRNKIHLEKPEVTLDTILAERLDRVKIDVENRFTDYEFVQGKDGMELRVKGPGGEKATVRFTGDLQAEDPEAANIIFNQD